MKYFIFTNNTQLTDENATGMPIRHVELDAPAYYDALLDLLQTGHELISAPLPPNVPLIRSPIRSCIVQSVERKYDTEGILQVDKAIERSVSLGILSDEKTRKDLEFIDRDHILRAVAQLRALDN